MIVTAVLLGEDGRVESEIPITDPAERITVRQMRFTTLFGEPEPTGDVAVYELEVVDGERAVYRRVLDVP